jgi:hypothetical protein
MLGELSELEKFVEDILKKMMTDKSLSEGV